MDKPDLTKERAIWISIRILGVIFALKAVMSLFRLVTSLITVGLIGVPGMPITLLVQSILLNSILVDCAIISVTVYLLFFAKRGHRLIDKTTPTQDENTCLSTLLATIAVRTFGIGLIFGGIIKLVNYISTIISFQLMKTLLSKSIEDGSVSSNEFIEKILNFGFSRYTAELIYVLGFALGAFYFLKYGKLIIRLLSRKQ